jgi:hypothetical protein
MLPTFDRAVRHRLRRVETTATLAIELLANAICGGLTIPIGSQRCRQSGTAPSRSSFAR